MKKLTLFSILFFLLLSSNKITKAQVLAVPQIIQEQTEWCWSASTKCMLQYFGKTYTQCQIAEYARSVITWHNFGTVNCCSDPGQGCNYWNYNWGYAGSIQDILTHFGSISVTNSSAALTTSQILTQISAGHPFIFRWGWYSGGGHFMTGYGIKGTDIYYMNSLPGYGYEIASYAWLKDDGTSHTWTHTQTLCMPSVPGTITGDTDVCQNTTQTYSIAPVSGATSYIWTLPFGWTGSSTSESITATVSNYAGSISVKAMNSCGTTIAQIQPLKVNKVDTSVTLLGKTLKSNAAGATYQWVKCPSMAIISGETKQTFSPTSDGTYAAKVIENSCSFTTNCYTLMGITGIKDESLLLNVSVYPNPVSNTLTLVGKDLPKGDYKIILTSTLGQKMIENEISLNNNILESELNMADIKAGIYFLQIQSDKINRTFKIQKL